MTKLSLVDPALFGLTDAELSGAITAFYRGNPGGFKSQESLVNERERRSEVERITQRIDYDHPGRIKILEAQILEIRADLTRDAQRLAKLERIPK